ncbi:MAG: ACP S-malonyltransferase [Gammaproteobacteria bacterium]|nr:ACP S-malonyltransferase [Gammaproteobacteria bacterium]
MDSLAIVFPGQGSQSVGMLSDLATTFPIIQKTFLEASDVLGYDLWTLTQKGPADKLDETVHTQPAILTASYALWRVLQSHHAFKPAVMAGHSLGEYSALLCANVFDFADAVRLVALRGQYMQEAVPFGAGALAVIVGLSEEDVSSLCQQAAGQDVLSPANFNSPGQVVISGHAQAIERALVLAKTLGAKMAKLLPVSVPSHCLLMKPAAERFEKALADVALRAPTIPVINNVDVAVYQDAAQIREGLLRQLYSPVRWVETIVAFQPYHVTRVLECGPGKVLSGLMKRINNQINMLQFADVLA